MEQDYDFLLGERMKTVNRENEREIEMLVEDYKKEIATTEEEHQAALQREREKFDSTFQQLEESHHEIRRQEKVSFERKVQKITLDMEKKKETMQIKMEEQIMELQKCLNDSSTEREELHLNYGNQIKLTKKEYEEKMAQFDITLKKKMSEKEISFRKDIAQNEIKHQDKIEELNVLFEEKSVHSRKMMDEHIKTLHSQHQHALEKVIHENSINESKWNTQIEDTNKELGQTRKESNEIISKLNQELIQSTMETESWKKKYQKKINFLKTALKLQFSLERNRFVTAKKAWEKKLHENQQLLDVARASLEKETFLKQETRKELHEIQQIQEREKKEAEMEIKRLTESYKEKILQLEYEREVERQKSFQKVLTENANQQEMRARQKQLTEELEVFRAERIQLINQHGKKIQDNKETTQKEAIKQKEKIIRLENVNEGLSNEIERTKKQLANEQKGVFELARMSQEQEEKDCMQIKDLRKKLERLRTREDETRQMQKALEERYTSDLNMEVDTFKRQFAKDRKELTKQYSDLDRKFKLREKQHNVSLMKMSEKTQKERRDLQKTQKSNHVELTKLKEKVLKEFSKDLEKEKKRLRVEIETEIEKRLRNEYQAKLSWKSKKQTEKSGTLSKTIHQEVSKLQKHLPIALKPTDREGIYTFGARKIHLVVIDGRLSVRVGGGYLTFWEFVNKYGEMEANKLKKAVLEKSGKENSGKKYVYSKTIPRKSNNDKKHRHRIAAFDLATPLSNSTNLLSSRKSRYGKRNRLSWGKGETL